MRTNRIIATVAVMGAALFVTAPAASANSFGDRYLGGGAHLSYDDGTDTLCLRNENSSYRASLTASPTTAGRGPTLSFDVGPGKRECHSLATAYEDSHYDYYGAVASECRCYIQRYSGGFYS
jgi:hypothetical protein